MEELGFGYKRTLVTMSVCGLFLCATALLCQHANIVPALLIGLIISVLYYALLEYQLKRVADMPQEQAISYLKKGSFSRFSLVVIGILFMYREPGLNIIAFLTGLFLPFRMAVFVNDLRLLRQELIVKGHVGMSTGISHPLLHGRHYTQQ